MPRIEVEAIVTTTHRVEAYGGVRLADSVLHEMATALRSGAVPMLQQHDIRRPLDASVVDAGVRDRPDGYKELWVRFTVDRDQWEAFERERDALGARGGFSFAGSTPIATLGRLGQNAQTAVWLDADAAHWTEDEIRSAGEHLRVLGPVDVGFRYQFAADPVAVVALGIAGSIALGIVSNALYDALKSFVRRGKPTTFHFRVQDGDRSVAAFLETDDTEVLRQAIETFDRVAKPSSLLVWDADRNEWRVR